ncbi:hypothetical protein RJ55_03824 [Drechmeria coniospora]|nr:hypothetical protein RJ55_03824 [Drechmeria coniospora]
MPLDVAIIGAGIAGLTAAVSLRRNGHRVQVYESSEFSGEIGAALNLTPNGVRVLQHLGFDFERARAVQMLNWDTVNGIDLGKIVSQDLSAATDIFGAPFYSVHRVDLHNELMRLADASEPEDSGAGTEVDEAPGGIELHLGSRVARVDAQEGKMEFVDGKVKHADLIVGADGLRSVVREAVLQDADDPPVLQATGQSAFRFLIPTEDLKQTPAGQDLLAWKSSGACLLADTKLIDKERHIMWGMIQNFVGIHPTEDTVPSSDADQEVREQMLKQFGHFDAKIVRILEFARDAKCWPLFSMKPLSSWTCGKAVLIGDAAHPMLPFGGQGANQAIEDGGVLGRVLKGVDDLTILSERLAHFSKLRLRRASRVQILSSVRANQEGLVRDKLSPYMETGVTGKSTRWAGQLGHRQ